MRCYRLALREDLWGRVQERRDAVAHVVCYFAGDLSVFLEEQNVLWGEVAVDDVLRVEVLQAVSDLDNEVSDCVCRDSRLCVNVLLDEGLQVSAVGVFHELHNDMLFHIIPVCDGEFQYSAHILMV